MLKAILATTVLITPSITMANETYLLIHGVSYHKKVKNNKTIYNQKNAGLGLGLEFDHALKPFVEAGTYNDSYHEQAYYAMTGIRYPLLNTDIKPYLKVSAGYLNGSGFNSLIAYPSLTVEYKKWAVEMFYAPSQLTHHQVADIYAAWLKYQF